MYMFNLIQQNAKNAWKKYRRCDHKCVIELYIL